MDHPGNYWCSRRVEVGYDYLCEVEGLLEQGSGMERNGTGRVKAGKMRPWRDSARLNDTPL